MLSLVATALILLADPPKLKPSAILLDARGRVEVTPSGGVPQPAAVGDLLYPGERLKVPADGAATVAILGLGVQEQLTPGTEATVEAKGCTPPEAVARRKEPPKAVANTMKGLRPVVSNGRKLGVGLRSGAEDPPAIAPIFGATVASDRPALAWPPAKDATSYRVRLLASSGRELWKLETKENQTAFPVAKEPLRRGYVFRWEVVDQDFRPVALGEFSVATESELKQLDELKPLASADDRADLLSAALSYRRLGAFAEAIAAYARLLNESPNEPAYREPLAELFRQAGRPKEPQGK
jgi:hypothetical protein